MLHCVVHLNTTFVFVFEMFSVLGQVQNGCLYLIQLMQLIRQIVFVLLIH